MVKYVDNATEVSSFLCKIINVKITSVKQECKKANCSEFLNLSNSKIGKARRPETKMSASNI